MDIETEFALFELERNLLKHRLGQAELADRAEMERLEGEQRLLEIIMLTQGMPIPRAEGEIADHSERNDPYETLYLWVARLSAKVDHLLAEKPQPPKVASPYLTSGEAAAYLRLDNVKKLYGLIERGKLKPLPGSRNLRFTIEMLDDFLRGEQ